LEFLLETEAGQEDRVADEKEREDEKKVKDLQSDELGQSIASEADDPP
jgi:hypothetical protein